MRARTPTALLNCGPERRLRLFAHPRCDGAARDRIGFAHRVWSDFASTGEQSKRPSPEQRGHRESGLNNKTRSRAQAQEAAMQHVAIDLGGKESQVCIRNEAGKTVQETKVATRKLATFFKQQPSSRVVLETCAEAFRVADLALERGHEVRVVPATLVRSLGAGAHSTKTDHVGAWRGSRHERAFRGCRRRHYSLCFSSRR